MNTEDYRELIDRLMREMTGEPVLNGSHGHATIIIERMFANAIESVRILTRRFDPRIYGTSETVRQAELMLGDPDRKIEILVEEADPVTLAGHPFFERLSANVNVNLFVRQVPTHLRQAIAINFATMDDSSFRFEKDKTEPVALARFGDTKFTSGLNDLYDSVWDSSAELPLAVHAH